jgi:hypothetical protein
MRGCSDDEVFPPDATRRVCHRFQEGRDRQNVSDGDGRRFDDGKGYPYSVFQADDKKRLGSLIGAKSSSRDRELLRTMTVWKG